MTANPDSDPQKPWRRPSASRIAAAERRQAEIEAELAELRARAQQADQEDETRLRLVLGSLVRDGLPHSSKLQDYVRRELPARLTRRERERGLWQRLFPGEPDPEIPDRA